MEKEVGFVCNKCRMSGQTRRLFLPPNLEAFITTKVTPVTHSASWVWHSFRRSKTVQENSTNRTSSQDYLCLPERITQLVAAARDPIL